jgi:sigma-B regulation protein RsbU (phosphoserine phosphatase)
MTLHLRATVSSGAPVYRQVADQLRAAAENGVLAAGDALPAAALLARDLVIHPTAVTRAYDLLKAEGVIERQNDHVVVATRSARPTPAALHSRHLRDASEVQRTLLPAGPPIVRGLDAAATSRPALGLGGDYFDFLPASGDRLSVVCADVAGKGMAAALLMATLRAFVHSHVDRDLPLPVLASTLNRRLYDSTSPSRFATFCLARYDAATRTVEYVNAGHQPPLVYRAASGAFEHLAVNGPALGILPDATFDSARLRLAEGDLLVLFSDGVLDATSAAGDEFGEARLQAAVAASARLDARTIVGRALEAVDGFAAGVPQFDDLTLVVLRGVEAPA